MELRLDSTALSSITKFKDVTDAKNAGVGKKEWAPDGSFEKIDSSRYVCHRKLFAIEKLLY